MSPTWKAAVGVILVFILGWLGGTVTTIVVARHKAQALAQGGPEALAIALERRTTRDLGLDADQKTKVHAVLVDYVRQRLELQKQLQPQVKVVNRQTLDQINAILNADQQQHFHDNLVVFKQRFGRNPFNVSGEDKTTATVVPPSSSESVPPSPTQ